MSEKLREALEAVPGKQMYVHLENPDPLRGTWMRLGFSTDEMLAALSEAPSPVDMLLFCPKCFEQHVDKPVPELCETCGHPEVAHVSNKADLKCWIGAKCSCDGFKAWLNPPHKSHRCNWCNNVWRPADVPTNGVQKLETSGKADGSPKPVASEAPSPWVEIKSEADLPKVSGEYVVTRGNNWFALASFHAGQTDWGMAKAYLPTPIPEYKEPK